MTPSKTTSKAGSIPARPDAQCSAADRGTQTGCELRPKGKNTAAHHLGS